jgi:tRNA 2-thiouridine synthesizing protein A
MNHQLDARRLLCPMPVIKTQNVVKGLKTGDTLEITCTDPGVMNDIPTWCRMNGHQVLEVTTIEHDIMIKIRIGAKD